MNPKAVTILAILALAGAGAAYYLTTSSPSTTDGATAPGAGLPALPDLKTRAADVAQITIKRAPMEFTIHKDADTWRVTEKANYPAKPDTVREVLVGLAQLKLDEPKTSLPDQYAKLGVDDPIAPPPDSADKPAPQSALITLKDSAGKDIAAVILGNPKYGGQGVVGTSTPQVYLRKPGDKQSWLASGQVEVPREPIAWLETKFADIKRDRIKSIVVTHPGTGGVVTVSRDKQADPFTVKDIPQGRELKDPGVAETIAASLTGLSFQDVAASSAADPAAVPAGTELKPGPTIVLRTFDGLVVTVAGVSKEAKAWWRLAASADDAVLSTLPPAASVTPTTPSDPAAPAPPTPASPPVSTPEAIRKEVADLNAEWSAYAFAPMDWKVRSVNTTMPDLLKEPTPPAAPSAPPTVPTAPPPKP